MASPVRRSCWPKPATGSPGLAHLERLHAFTGDRALARETSEAAVVGPWRRHMSTQILRVNTCEVIVVLALSVSVIGCGESNNPARPSAVAGAEPLLATASAGAVTDATFNVGPELAAVRQATARFHDISDAYAAGYTTENEPCVESPDGVMGIHAPNFALLGDPAIIATQPELLLYAPQPNGKLRLTGVEYFQVVLLRNTATNEVAPWVSQAPWPAGYEVANPTPTLFGQTFDGPMPGHTPTMPWHWDLHAWIWAHNPSGMFSEWNPSLRCG